MVSCSVRNVIRINTQNVANRSESASRDIELSSSPVSGSFGSFPLFEYRVVVMNTVANRKANRVVIVTNPTR